MDRSEIQDPSLMLAILFGIEGAEILKFVEDEDGGAFTILIKTPLTAAALVSMSSSLLSMSQQWFTHVRLLVTQLTRC